MQHCFVSSFILLNVSFGSSNIFKIAGLKCVYPETTFGLLQSEFLLPVLLFLGVAHTFLLCFVFTHLFVCFDVSMFGFIKFDF